MPNVGPWEVFLLLLLALLLFGAKRLPEIGRSMGKGFREFKDSVAGKVDLDDDVPELPAATMNDATTKAEEPVVARERERDTA
jgi:sec-independent protein translocase protein TatA